MKANCITCSKEYTTYPSHQARRPNGGYCSRQCRPHIIIECKQCGSQIHTNKSDSEYCSKRCKKRFLLREKIESFMSHVDKVNDCWIWKGPFTTKNGERLFPSFNASIKGNTCARIASFRIFINPEFEPNREHWVTASCGNLMCVNPKHLILLTPTEVMQLRNAGHYYK
jgi:hypothetical protein